MSVSGEGIKEYLKSLLITLVVVIALTFGVCMYFGIDFGTI